jgi:hypothetical protein
MDVKAYYFHVVCLWPLGIVCVFMAKIPEIPLHFFKPHFRLEIPKGQIRTDTSVFHKLFLRISIEEFIEIRYYLPFTAPLNDTGSVCFCIR